MIYDLILFGSVIFWTIIALTAVFITFVVDSDDAGSAATVALVVVGLFLLAFSRPQVSLDSTAVLLVIAGYFAIGCLWALFKWNWFLNSVRAYMQGRSREMKLASDLAYKFNVRTFPPEPSEQAGRITTWLFYWPFSIAGWVLREPAKALYNFTIGLMRRMSQSKFEGMDQPK